MSFRDPSHPMSFPRPSMPPIRAVTPTSPCPMDVSSTPVVSSTSPPSTSSIQTSPTTKLDSLSRCTKLPSQYAPERSGELTAPALSLAIHTAPQERSLKAPRKESLVCLFSATLTIADDPINWLRRLLEPRPESALAYGSHIARSCCLLFVCQSSIYPCMTCVSIYYCMTCIYRATCDQVDPQLTRHSSRSRHVSPIYTVYPQLTRRSSSNGWRSINKDLAHINRTVT